MKQLLCVLALLSAVICYSQNSFKISGTVVSQDDKSPLEAATVYLERIQDSTLVTYTISDKNGYFEIQEKTYDDHLNLVISYVGLEEYKTKIDVSKSPINLGEIAMESANSLEEVVITSRAPITIKKDTLEFNVKSFKTKKDATVEDLLKELPGVEVDENGKIKVNGKEVNKILVNGKPFFGDDPTITTRNLTKEIIEKIQIVDTKTKSEAFTGEEGDNENKTINLTIKEENNKGVFGRLAAGGGTDKRYEFAGIVNVFDNDQRISVLAGGNNINSPGFSFGEIEKMFGGGSMYIRSDGSFGSNGRSFGGGEGITVSNNVGANFADKLAKGIDVSADYFLAASNSDNEIVTKRENILPDRRYFTESYVNSNSNTDNHSSNLEFDIEVDSTFLINVRPSFRILKSQTTYSRDESSLDELGALINASNSSSYVETTGRNFSNDFNVTKRFGNKGTFIKFDLNTGFNSTETDDYSNSQTMFEDDTQNIDRDQYSDGKQNFESLFARIAYRLPLIAKTLFLNFEYSTRNDTRENVRSTFDFDDAAQDYINFNEDLSTNFNYSNKRNTPSLGLSYQKEKWSLRMEAGYVFRTLESRDELRPEMSLKQNFEALELNGRFHYRFSPKSSIYSGYYLSNQPPQITQMSPFQDVSDPLNIVTGNPSLEPANRHSFYGGFNSFDFQKKTGFWGYASVNVTENQVVSRSVIDEDLVRYTTYENVDGNYRVYADASYAKSIKMDSLKTLRLRVGTNTNISRAVNFNNDQQYAAKNRAIGPNARITFTWKDIMELEPNYRVTFNKSTYNLENFDDQEFIRHDLGIRTATFLPKKFEWRNDIKYSYNPNVSSGFQKSAWFWNSTLAYSVLKDQGTVTLKVYDLLNQNTNAQRTATENYIQDRQSSVLQQYFMLSFSWKFNSLGKKGEIDDFGGF
ncbi:TonB-dependent receptor [Mangrovimonas sp. YM274]|uniref:TonB-dependent receptor n=1 Tax=Mangrovimonas sp. YM274 TaxID=3070660 RepID=UPI0027DB048E|nr:TonB-dependent receptor [Mangrovimonas sp. YM274]WMI69700.1 TonB-dependent receptor [Mangrovimonas sp. YM274]